VFKTEFASVLSEKVKAVFAVGGDLPKAIDGFRARDSQVELAQSIAQTIEQGQRLVAEAGTGTGKTFAYLVPALLSGRKVVISTGTKTLQDQLFNRDLPKIVESLGLSVHYSLLKGRSNYVCHHHLRRNLQEARFERASDGATLRKIEWFASRSKTGDRSDCLDVEETNEAWVYASSTRDNCLGQECADWDQCFVIRARKQALAAELVVINHHLFCADASLRDEGVAEILPQADVLIFDEAHQLPETCVQFFGTTLSTRQITDLVRDTLVAGLTEAKDATQWPGLMAGLERAVRELRLAWPLSAPRQAGFTMAADEGFVTALGDLVGACDDMDIALTPIAVRGPGLERCLVRLKEIQQSLTAWQQALLGSGPGGVVVNPDEPATTRVQKTQGQDSSDPDDEQGPQVCWAQSFGPHLSLHLTPMYIGRLFGKRLDASPQQSAIFLSATLAVDGKFDYFKRQLGLKDAKSQFWESPFDYANNAMLFLPQGLGDPNHADFTTRLLQEAWPLIEKNRGRVFLLFTSLRSVKKAADWLRVKLPGASFDGELLVQGEIPKQQLLERFRVSKAPLLVGSASFWEGVDVVGEQLSMVVIDKIPFAPPDDPMLQARIDLLKKRGIDPFSTLQIPAAAISMKQGAGRLIRSETDRGLLMIGDARLRQRGYGKQLLRSLPPFATTEDSALAMAFISKFATTTPR
jgi:ATP-dependent DNA helicase DinG